MFKLDKHDVEYFKCTKYHTVQRLMSSKGAKRTIFYHITVILQYSFIITTKANPRVVLSSASQTLRYKNSSVKTVPKCLRKLEVFFNKNIDVSSLWMSSLRAIVICQKYFENHVKSSIHLFAPLLDMRRCTLWVWYSTILLCVAYVFIIKTVAKMHLMCFHIYFKLPSWHLLECAGARFASWAHLYKWYIFLIAVISVWSLIDHLDPPLDDVQRFLPGAHNILHVCTSSHSE